jgi:hypothetical protein
VITPDEAILSGDVVDIITPKAFEVANTYTIAQIDAKYNTRTRWTKTFSASATVISGVDDNSLSLLYTAGYEEVYLNGILLTPITDYARTSASVVTLGAAVVTNDIIEIVNTQPFNVADTYTTTQADNKFLTQVSASSTYQAQATNGMVLLNTTSFSGQSSVSINDIFSATYKNYKIILDTVASTSIAIRARLRVGGTDNSTSSSYTSQEVRGSSTTASAFSTVDNFFQFGYANTTASLVELTLINPFLSVNTSFSSFGGRSDRSALVSGFHNQTTSYTGITWIAESGTITGTLYIYGYKN